MADMMNNTAPAVSTPVDTAPAVTEISDNGINTPSDIFAEFERKLGLADDQQMDDLSKAKKYEEKSIEELYGEQDKEPSAEDLIEGSNNEQVQEEVTEQNPEDFKYEFKGKIGNSEKEIAFNNKQELDNWIKKGYVADVLYTKNKELQNQIAEAGQYKEGHEFAQRFDKMVAEDPFKVIEAIVEDMDEAQLSDWLIQKAEHLSRPRAEREMERKLKEAETLREELANIRAQQEQLAQQRIQAAQEADRHAVKSWGESLLGKVQARVPEEYHGIMQDTLRSTLLEGKHRQNAGETVTIKTLDKIFATRAKPLLDLIQSRSQAPVNINAKVGEAIQGKKQDGLSRIQQATSSYNQANKSKKPEPMDGGISDMFDSLIKGVDRGNYKMRG